MAITSVKAIEESYRQPQAHYLQKCENFKIVTGFFRICLLFVLLQEGVT